MASISEIEWEPCLLTQRPAPELEKRFEKETGRPGQMMQYFEASPWAADTMLRVAAQISTVVRLDPDMVDQAGLVISQDNSCRFCFGVQRAFLRVLGMSEERIRQLEQALLTGDFTERERAAIEFARRVSNSKPLVDETHLLPLRENGFSDDEIAELCGLIALHLFMNRNSTFVALPPNDMETFPDRWWVKLLRPLVARKFAGLRRKVKPVALLETEKHGPLAPFVNALDGLPLARDLRIIFDRLWAASSLPTRTVCFIYAVIARALGSTTCEEDARAQLLSEGVDEADIDQVLTHLSAPGLSELERKLIPLARETVWYQPAQVQRRFAELQSQVSAAEFLDFVGAVSLLNAVCRLGVMDSIRQ